MIRKHLKSVLEYRGWYLRRTSGLPEGVDLSLSIKRHDLVGTGALFDVGAHRGETVEYFVDNFPNQVFAFEPVAANFRNLEARFGSHPRVKLVKSALGSESKTVTIALQQDSQTHSLRHQRTTESGAETLESVTVITLDEFVSAHKIGRIDLLKIDTEGYELEVLKGAADTLAKGHIRAVFCEVTLDPDDDCHTQLSSIIPFLATHHFRFAGLFDQVLWNSPLRLAYANALFIHES